MRRIRDASMRSDRERTMLETAGPIEHADTIQATRRDICTSPVWTLRRRGTTVPAPRLNEW
jgi:hypothetical protein